MYLVEYDMKLSHATMSQKEGWWMSEGLKHMAQAQGAKRSGQLL